MEKISPSTPGIPGRRVTLAVLLGLVLVGGWVSYTLWSYNRLDTARAATAKTWRELAEQLSSRYRQVEKLVAEGVDQRTLDMEFGEQFRLAVDGFRTTAQPPMQYASSLKLETLLASNPKLGTLPPQPPALLLALDSHNRCLRNEARILHSPGGTFLSWFLKFPIPVEMTLAE